MATSSGQAWPFAAAISTIFYLSYAATNRMKLALVFEVGKQQSETAGHYDTWHTAAAFLQYKLAERVSTTLRGEYYYAERGVIIKDITPAAK